MTSPYNPLAGLEITEAEMVREIEHDVLEGNCGSLPPDEKFFGVGIYMLYYQGNFSGYEEIAEPNREDPCSRPVYVGKAVPAGSRKGRMNVDFDKATDLFRRLRQHARTIDEVENLSLGDFRCSYVVLEPLWIPLVEQLFISHHRPWWNKYIDGFGNHDPGKGRYNQKQSAWDTLHPGRYWAERCQPFGTPEDVWRIVNERRTSP